jgi:hypothetical protein
MKRLTIGPLPSPLPNSYCLAESHHYICRKVNINFEGWQFWELIWSMNDRKQKFICQIFFKSPGGGMLLHSLFVLITTDSTFLSIYWPVSIHNLCLINKEFFRKWGYHTPPHTHPAQYGPVSPTLFWKSMTNIYCKWRQLSLRNFARFVNTWH